MNPNLYSAMAENPEYQGTIRKLMQAHPAIKAVVNLREADEAFMGNLIQNQQALEQMGLKKRTFAGEFGLESGLGLQNLRTRLSTETGIKERALALGQSQLEWSNLIGATNVGVGLYGLKNKLALQNKLASYYLNQ